MMIDPYSYIEEKKNWNLDKLYKEKDYLEQYIKNYKKEKYYFINSSPNVIASVYEEYLIELNRLLAEKERENKTEKRYIELNEYNEIKSFLQKNDFFEGAEIYKIFNKKGTAEICIKDGEQEIEFYLYEVDDFFISYFTDEIYIDSICVNNLDGKISLKIDDIGIYISAKSIKLKTLDIDNTIYTYVSVKFKENQNKTFYYISNIENLKIGDYVYVPVRETSCPAIVKNIEKFSYRNVPFPLNRTKIIIRRSSKNEFEDYNRKNVNEFKEDYSDFESDFKFEDFNTIKDRVKKLPYIKRQKVEWEGIKENDDNSFSMPFPKYDKAVIDWIEAFYNLKLLDYNYVENFNYLKDKTIEKMDFYESLSYLTYIIRGERFCDGLIASNLENGNIELLEKRLFSYLTEFTEIDDNNIRDFEEKDIMFFTLAETGAMGEPNGIEIVTKKENAITLYHTNISEFDVRKLYSKFSTLKTLNCGIFGVVTGVQSGFVHVDTGMGNHLFINESINNEFQEKIKTLQPFEIYNRWLIIGLDLLEFDWNKVGKLC